MANGISTVAVGESAVGHSHRECILMYNVCAASAFIDAQIEFNRWFKSQAADPRFTLLDTTQLSIALTVIVPSSGCKNVTQPQLHPVEGIYN
jgi:hypothetical protein